MRALAALVALAVLAPTALAQSPFDRGTGFVFGLTEAVGGGSFNGLAGAEEAGGLDGADHHLYGLDATFAYRLKSGIEIAFRPGIYRYDPTGLGARVGLGASGTRALWTGGGLRIAAEGIYRLGEYDHPEERFTGAAYAAQGEIALTQRLPLLGTVAIHPTAGVYGEIQDIYDVSGSSNNDAFEGIEGHAGAVVSAPIVFKLVDARVAIAPSTRFALVQTGRLPAFEGAPGAGIWIDF